MTPLQALKQVVFILEKEDCKYCLIGGHAASLYRAKERLTKDVDFALMANPISESRKLAQKTIKSLGLKPLLGFIPPREKERKRKSICLVTSAPLPNEIKGIIDILLPELPWIKNSIKRAQHNRIDLGFAAVPTITPEDLIIAKCYAVNNSPDRFQDLDDLKELFESVAELDVDYLRDKLDEFDISIPKPIEKFAPSKLLL